jgi:hypothetical protein
MQLTLTIAQMLVRLCGVLLLIIGLLIWTGNARNLIPIHMLLGLVFVLALLVQAGMSTRAGAPVGLAAGVALMAVIVLVLGLNQTTLMPGSSHWVIEVLHLLVGMAAIGMAEALGGRLRRIRLASA